MRSRVCLPGHFAEYPGGWPRPQQAGSRHSGPWPKRSICTPPISPTSTTPASTSPVWPPTWPSSSPNLAQWLADRSAQTRRWEQRVPASRPRLAEPTFGLARADRDAAAIDPDITRGSVDCLVVDRLAMLGTDVDAGHGDGEQRGVQVTLIAGGPWPSTSGAQLGSLTSGPHEPLRGIGGGVG